jgi:hypothetical protein
MALYLGDYIFEASRTFNMAELIQVRDRRTDSSMDTTRSDIGRSFGPALWRGNKVLEVTRLVDKS